MLLKMNNHPIVTVGVANYNNSKYIIETLESIRNQSYENIELIIVDDCSNDDSISKIEDWIKIHKIVAIFLKHTKNKGLSKTCNALLNSSNGKYIALIGDDIMEADRIETQVHYLEKHKELSLCFSDMSMINGEGKEINSSFLNFNGESSLSINSFLSYSTLDQLAIMMTKNFFPTPSFLYNTSVLKKLGGWDEELYIEDWDMFLRLINSGYKFGFIADSKLVKYRFLPKSAARTPNYSFYSAVLKSLYKYKGRSAEINNAINENILKYSFMIYELGGLDSKWLFLNWKITKNFKMLVFAVLAFLGIKLSFIRSLKNSFRIY